MASISPHETVQLPRRWALGFACAAGLGFMSGGFTLGVLASHGFSSRIGASATGTLNPTRPLGAGDSGGAAAAGPFAVGSLAPFTTSVYTLTGHPTTLARGTQGTVVMAMASWCLFCGYDDKWVLPVLAKTPGVTVDIVDVSPQGGIADPGPQSPAFSGHDGQGVPLTVAGMETTMQQYVKTFGTLTAPNIHVYVAPQTTQSSWHIQSFPTLAFIGPSGKVVVAPNGAQTLSQAQSDLQQALQS